jgi:hypothetical protein
MTIHRDIAMLRLTPRYRLQVPHGLAIVGALLLLAGTVAGVGNGFNAPPGNSATATTFVAGGDMDTADSSPGSMETIPQTPVKQKKRFKINLFLFRH